MNVPLEAHVRLLTAFPDNELERRCGELGIVSNDIGRLRGRLSTRLVELRALSADALAAVEKAARRLDLVLVSGIAGALVAVGEEDAIELAARLDALNSKELGNLAQGLRRIAGFKKADRWSLPGRELILSEGPLVMGILNVTPDSFYDGGRYVGEKSALARAALMLEQGASIIDVGGESTRPGAEPVTEKEEAARVLPVIRGIMKDHPRAVLSVDTTRAAVAARAIDAGAAIVNDVSAGCFDPDMLKTVSSGGAAFVAMHMRGTPRTMQRDTDYHDLTGEIYEYFIERLDAARKAEIPREMIALDPGIGFGKSREANYELISRLGEFLPLRCPLLVGPSRKSFLGGGSGTDRLEGTLAALTVAVLAGASILRVHDIPEALKTVSAASRFRVPAPPAGSF